MGRRTLASHGHAAAGFSAEPAAPTPPQRDDGVAAKVAALPAGQRAGVLLRAVRDAGQDCQGVEDARAVGDTGRDWLARCTGGQQYLVEFGNGGTVRVTDAQAAAKAARGG